MNRLLIKALLSTMLLLCVLLICLTGGGLYFSHSGLVLGLPRHLVKNLHALCWLAMLAAIIPHFILNLRLFAREWRGAVRAKAAERTGRDGKAGAEHE